MKNIIFIAILCPVTNLIAQMQNQETLFLTNEWRLQKLEINQNTIPAPNNNELNFPILDAFIINGTKKFGVQQCLGGSGEGEFYFTSNTDLHIVSYAASATLCNSQSNESFNLTYNYDFFWSNMSSSFNVTINQQSTYLEMIIQGSNGNKAFYHNNLSASSEKLIKEKVNLFPNPVSDVLFLSGDQNVIDDISKIRIYDLSGKIVLESNKQFEGKFNLSSIFTGTYIVSFLYKNKFITHSIILKN